MILLNHTVDVTGIFMANNIPSKDKGTHYLYMVKGPAQKKG